MSGADVTKLAMPLSRSEGDCGERCRHVRRQRTHRLASATYPKVGLTWRAAAEMLHATVGTPSSPHAPLGPLHTQVRQPISVRAVDGSVAGVVGPRGWVVGARHCRRSCCPRPAGIIVNVIGDEVGNQVGEPPAEVVFGECGQRRSGGAVSVFGMGGPAVFGDVGGSGVAVEVIIEQGAQFGGGGVDGLGDQPVATVGRRILY